MSWKLKVKEYGKIRNAEIEVAPLTLFVGDNNSGKSYLMSLLWGIKNLGIQVLLGSGIRPQTKSEQVLFDWIKLQVTTVVKQGGHAVSIGSMANIFQSVLQEKIDQNKEEIVKRIFNSSGIEIGELKIEFMDLEQFPLNFIFHEGQGAVVLFTEDSDKFGIRFSNITEDPLQLSEKGCQRVLEAIFSLILCVEPNDRNLLNRDVYLPAAKTGFMLTKDVINKVNRKRMFDIEVEEEEISPFTRPINQFLDVMNDLSFGGAENENFVKAVEYLEFGMADGTVEMSALPNREILYIPSGKEKVMPLRIVSAVVTELSPLILILKHKRNLNSLFYEEPEMCLHPRLQQKMARVLCQLVNSPLNMVITTHSDIILQYVNKMIRLSEHEDAEEICRQYKYTQRDILSSEKVKVYQFRMKSGKHTEVEEVCCGKNGFAISSFNDALDQIMDEAYTIQE